MTSKGILESPIFKWISYCNAKSLGMKWPLFVHFALPGEALYSPHYPELSRSNLPFQAVSALKTNIPKSLTNRLKDSYINANYSF